MLEFLSKIFHAKGSDLEAKLRPTPEYPYDGVGEVEIETWSDGAVRLEASIKYTGIEDGTQ